MTQPTTAFKMPYFEKQREKYVTFDKKHVSSNMKRKKEVFLRLGRNDDTQTQNFAVLGYN